MWKKTKIATTLGPASYGCIEALARAGASIFRVNFSHGCWETHAQAIEGVRRAEETLGDPICVLADLQGPKIRIGDLPHDLPIVMNQIVQFGKDIPLPHPELFDAACSGSELLIDDGRLSFEVISVEPGLIQTRALNNGLLKSRKGVSLRGAPQLLIPALTQKDRADLAFALEQKVDWIAISFVQTAEDVKEVKRIVDKRARVMAKIEKPQAVEAMDSIIRASDGVMVARGDLGVEMCPEDVPGIQRQLIRHCREVGKPVVVATQMLESMVESSIPTRAEASDVAGAVFEGADAVMLSAETATGKYPIEAVTIMSRIISRCERDPLYPPGIHAVTLTHAQTPEAAITGAVSTAATVVDAAAIVSLTESGNTALRISRERPLIPLIGLTARLPIARQMQMFWGVRPGIIPPFSGLSEMDAITCSAVLDMGIQEGARVVLTTSTTARITGSTNLMLILHVSSKDKALKKE